MVQVFGTLVLRLLCESKVRKISISYCSWLPIAKTVYLYPRCMRSVSSKFVIYSPFLHFWEFRCTSRMCWPQEDMLDNSLLVKKIGCVLGIFY